MNMNNIVRDFNTAKVLGRASKALREESDKTVEGAVLAIRRGSYWFPVSDSDRQRIESQGMRCNTVYCTNC